MKKDDPSDFFNCTAFGKTAELIANSLRKGSPIVIIGHMQMGHYTDKEGVKKYTADVIVDKFDFVGKKEGNQAPTNGVDEDVKPIDGDIPF